MNNRKLGVEGEEAAKLFLKNLGYKIIGQNFSYQGGELDIIAVDNDILVFVEVKTRENAKFGDPIESITVAKQKNMILGAKLFIQKHKLHKYQARFDIVAILRDNIEHIKDAFWIN